MVNVREEDVFENDTQGGDEDGNDDDGGGGGTLQVVSETIERMRRMKRRCLPAHSLPSLHLVLPPSILVVLSVSTQLTLFCYTSLISIFLGN